MSNYYDCSRIDQEKYPLVRDIFCSIQAFDNCLLKKDFDYVEQEYEGAKALCDELKQIAILNNDEYTANCSFIMRVNIRLISSFTQFWKLCEELEYEKAWCCLQDSLDSTRTLLKFLNGSLRATLMKLYNYLSTIEKLYPYNIFSSVGLENCTVKCSICGRSPFDLECTHISGELYWGEMAHHIICDMGELNHIALTPNPVDKRCVFAAVDYNKTTLDEGPFRRIHSFISLSRRPLRPYSLKKTEKELPRECIENVLDIDQCPCGSGLNFKDCCYDKELIIVPHYEIIFEELEAE